MATDRLATGPRRLLGLVMVGVVILFLLLCAAAYNRVFNSYVPVTMQITQVDNSFQPQAEVRLDGVTVGEVTEVTTDGSVATVKINLLPDEVPHIPRNVTARLLPKSLFGERFIALEAPKGPVTEHIQAGDVITRDRAKNTIQVEQTYEHLLPLIQAVRPADLASALGGLSQALDGRGQKLGNTITRVHQYLAQFNPALGDLTQDIQALPKVSDTYATAAPDLIEGLSRLTTTTNTLVEKKDDFARSYDRVTDMSHELTDWFHENGDNLVDLVHTARPTLELLARYSPEYVCLFNRLTDAIPLGDKAFGKDTARPALNITLDIVVNRGPFKPHLDEPEFTDNRGPACYNNTAPLPQYPGGPYEDGSSHPAAANAGSPALSLGSLITGTGAGPGDPLLPLLGSIGTSNSLTGSGPGTGVRSTGVHDK